MNQNVHPTRYKRAESSDRRVERGDDFAGDAWLDLWTSEVRWVAVGHDPNPETFLKLQPTCKHCRSEDVLREAMAKWDFALQAWVVSSTYDDYFCRNCDGETSIAEVVKEVEPASNIAANTLTRAEVEALFGYDGTLPFSRIIEAMAAKRDAYDLDAVKRAQTQFSVEGDTEIDDAALTSRSDDDAGCYVMAWLWVGPESPF